MRSTTRTFVAGLAVAGAIAGMGSVAAAAVAASSADAVQNLPAFKTDCNNDEPGRTFGGWQQIPIKRGDAGTAVYGWLVVGTYDTGYGEIKCVGVLPSGRTAGKGYSLTATALRSDAAPDVAAAASGTSSQKYVKTRSVVLDGEDDDPGDATSSDVILAVGTVDHWDLPTFASGSVRLL
jgi:hypothetical protein